MSLSDEYMAYYFPEPEAGQDIVQRLRSTQSWTEKVTADIRVEAAAEIESLRAEIAELNERHLDLQMEQMRVSKHYAETVMAIGRLCRDACDPAKRTEDFERVFPETYEAVAEADGMTAVIFTDWIDPEAVDD